MHTKIHTLEGWLRHREQLHPRNIDMGLGRVREVARRMVLRFDCPVITVAGTNGKGSTCAMLEAVALQAGYRTGVYTSPHLVHFEERCRVHGEIVAASDLIAHFEAVEAARTQNGDEVSLTYFEFTTLAILRLMSHSRLDVAILEVGLGGRLDATNVIDADCAVITSIDIDHTEFLGPDRESIGREKAGIMRTGRPAIVGDPMAPQSVIDHAREMALVAIQDDGFVGVARLVCDPGDCDSGEFALAVRSDQQRRGIGHGLMRLLIGYAKERGMDRIWGSIELENRRMLDLARELGFTADGPAQFGEVRVSLAL